MIVIVFAYPFRSDWMQTVHQIWRRGKESDQYLEHSEPVSTWSDQESEQLCSRRGEGRAVMKLLHLAHQVPVGKREWIGFDPYRSLDQRGLRAAVRAS